MAKKWNDFTRREKTISILSAILGVFVLGSVASGMSNPPSSSLSEQNSPQSVQTTKEVSETASIPFEKTSTESSLYDKGSTRVTTPGVAGEKTLTYRLTLVNGVETKRELVKEVVSKAPVTEVTTVGTAVKAAQQPQSQPSSTCDPNYSGACVPIASDVDCAGGRGNGPAYVRGPVYVIGTDIYGLDSNGDGVGCES